jgi:hypothetical protein
MEQRGTAPYSIELVLPLDILEPHEVHNGAVPHPLPCKPHRGLRRIKCNHLIAALDKGYGVSSPATPGIENAAAGTDMAEKALVERFQVKVSRLRGKRHGVLIIV